MSRWIIPAACAACRPAAVWATMSMVLVASSGPLGEHGLERGPGYEFHHQVGRLAVGRLAVVVDLRDVLVGQGRGVLCLGPEPGHGLGLLGVALVQQLDRHGPGQHRIRRAPHLAVSADADLLVEHVTSAEDRSR